MQDAPKLAQLSAIRRVAFSPELERKQLSKNDLLIQLLELYVNVAQNERDSTQTKEGPMDKGDNI